jgi:L-ascorbate metabolism protein UlaG (beta-lactamase superfamily)
MKTLTGNTDSPPALSLVATAVAALVLVAGCQSYIQRIVMNSLARIGEPVPAPARTIESAFLPNAELAVSWAGHATVLVQMREKLVLTDPLFTDHVGMVVKRSIGSGLDPSQLSRVDFVLISHLHFDHFSYGSLDQLPKGGVLILPEGGLAYTPDLGFRSIRELRAWESLDDDGVRITAVPVQHFSGRYGFDSRWMAASGYTGYVVEYEGRTVFVGGDTGYNEEQFKEIGRRFRVDVAFLPIAPGRNVGFGVHVGPLGALMILRDLGARYMVPIHYGTLFYGSDQNPREAVDQLLRAAEGQGMLDRVIALEVGEQRVIMERTLPAGAAE